jgi:hypothetical protein
MKYIKKSKASEADMMVRMLADGARAAVMEGGALPPSAGPTPPPGTCCQQGGRCMPSADLWSAPTWQALRFSIDDPFAYSYQFVSDGTSFTARAIGDLDCDGDYATFEITGQVVGGEVQMSPLSRMNELE